MLATHHREDAAVDLDGTLAARLPGFTGDYDEVAITPEALGSLRPGCNTLAIRCHQTGGGQYIDAGIVDLTPRTTPASIEPGVYPSQVRRGRREPPPALPIEGRGRLSDLPR